MTQKQTQQATQGFSHEHIRQQMQGEEPLQAPLPADTQVTAGAVLAKALDKQIGGAHYKQFTIQPTEFLSANEHLLGWRESNAIKYACRHKFKNGKQDILKAIHYLEMVLEEY